MAYPLDTAVETAISTIESVLIEDLTMEKSRHAIELWRELLVFIESTGASGYDALTQRNWETADNLYGENVGT